jgi:hypothetical protein
MEQMTTSSPARRVLVVDAKGVLMRRLHMDEASAYRRLRTASSNRNCKLVEVAREILQAEEVFAQLEGTEQRPPNGRAAAIPAAAGRSLSWRQRQPEAGPAGTSTFPAPGG